MKIAFIVTWFPALSQTFILNQITGLLDRGHEVDIYAYGPRNEPTIHGDVKRYDLLNHTCYISTSMPKNKFLRVIKGIVQIAANIHKKPMSVLNALNIVRFGKEAVSLSMLYYTISFLKNGPYDIVHCHFGPLGNQGIMLRTTGAVQGKIVTNFRGYDISSYIKMHGRHVYDSLFKKGDLFLCVSNQIRDTLIQLGCAEQKILVHRSGTHISKFLFSPRKAKTDGKVRLLTVSRLVEKKGVEYGIKAVAKVLKNYPNIDYKIAGDGPLKSTLQGLIEELNVGNNVRMLGWQEQERIMELLQQADLFLSPNVTSQNGDRDGIPGVIVEALACGLPVLSTRHSGIAEVIQDGESGFLVPERDSDALAARLEYLIEQSQLWAEMGRKGRMYVEQHYDIDILNDRLVEIYQQLLGAPRNQ